MRDRSGTNYSGVRAIRGPIMVITVGVLFALNNFTQYRFEETWPVIIIVAGLVSLLGRSVCLWAGYPARCHPPTAPAYPAASG